MDKIPVTLIQDSKEVKAFLSPVAGGGGSMYHLMVDDYYKGQLVKVATGWQFASQKHGYDPVLAEYFGGIINSTVEV